MYTGGFLNNELGKNGDVYNKFAGLCFESQAFPDSLHQPHFPNTVIKPGEVYERETLWHFAF